MFVQSAGTSLPPRTLTFRDEPIGPAAACALVPSLNSAPGSDMPVRPDVYA
jgi:hypothetical protein